MGDETVAQRASALLQHAANSLKPGHAAYAADVRFQENSGH